MAKHCTTYMKELVHSECAPGSDRQEAGEEHHGAEAGMADKEKRIADLG